MLFFPWFGPPCVVRLPKLMLEVAVPQERTEAVVLRGVDFSETSRIVTFLTPVRGRVACLAKGARRKNSRFVAALDTFNRVELVYYWKDGRGVQNLAEAAILDAFTGIKRSLEKTAYGTFVLELAGRAVHENEPSESMYQALVDGLKGLESWRGDARSHALWQAMRLLVEAGFEPVLDRCVRTGGSVARSPLFSYEGGVIADGHPADRRLSVQAIDALKALVAARDVCPDVAVPEEVLPVLTHYAARHLETDFRSTRVILEMFEKNG